MSVSDTFRAGGEILGFLLVFSDCCAFSDLEFLVVGGGGVCLCPLSLVNMMVLSVLQPLQVSLCF